MNTAATRVAEILYRTKKYGTWKSESVSIPDGVTGHFAITEHCQKAVEQLLNEESDSDEQIRVFEIDILSVG